ncbi:MULTISPECIES: ABC transporter ATP-binding protein [Clostridium]|uniref:Lipoprotein-releasing system ATP-binding protein LolD n=3 Tax=Clostridium TaxID=1485 RepID=D8GN24_CLOLD|nr:MULTISPECIES: ABC transporter ATP-binding protein [Clostridium]ADK13648.1 predicted ABC transporter, ATPase component [Clostridium ljungdahlii DSM 13528]AGY76865.1 ABC transporter ATP-binding protein [Clostridium autoethanogenum DSM 10061]ALU37013.1 Lipoprotein ABC transporter ATP-binding protein [Clostridium autoethanogenum DSM 10061]OAA84527.1 Lipoprotein-releasing system ATP-binding protein LolD [Clostridium ljungdahlii DSM 13528]OAA92769.1 Lipoprotein-releasing system ATP-binding protei
MDNIIQLENVNKIYGRRVKNKVLSEVNISVEKGSFNSIIGASGSGKTTLLNIMGMLDKPTTGEVYIQGKSIKSIGRNSRAAVRNKSIGFVFQFHYLLPEFNAIQNVLMPYRIKHFFCGRSAKRKAEELLELVGLSECKKKKVYDLSGGQQQRIAIARALMNDPSIVLADEPTGNLDSTNAESIYKLFRQINDKFSTTFIIVTHDVNIANKTDRIIQIKDGQVRD